MASGEWPVVMNTKKQIKGCLIGQPFSFAGV
jgi:hypothetical protein